MRVGGSFHMVVLGNVLLKEIFLKWNWKGRSQGGIKLETKRGCGVKGGKEINAGLSLMDLRITGLSYPYPTFRLLWF